MTNEELVALIQAGERDRIPELWEQVERLVRMHARRWDKAFDGRNGATLEDYMQAGFIGFLTAVDSYRTDMGVKFNTVLGMCVKTPFSEVAGVRTSKQRRVDSHWISLDAPATTDEDSDPLAYLIEDPNGQAPFLDIEARELHDAVSAALASLTEDEQEVVRLVYWNGLAFDRIAEKTGRSKADVTAVHSKALRKLRNPSRSKELWACWRMA